MWRWDIFCTVVDNYGDIGTCWRLAQQLAGEHEADVRLWVDRLQSFAQLCPAVSTDADQQRVGRIEIRRWRSDFPQVEAADVVIEAFACELPESYIAAMARQTVAPAWINLEYLSAEAWVEGCHRLPSLRTKWPLTKYFFFPGFTPRTGGLLRERDLLADRAAFDSAAEAEFWHSVGVPARSDHELRVSMFCYQNAALPDLLQCWADGHGAVTVLATPGPAADQVAGWFGEPFVAGDAAAAVIPDGLPAAVPAAVELRPAAVGMRREFRARRGLVRAGPMGRAAVRVADLSPGGRGAPGQAGGVLGPISRWLREIRRSCGGAGMPGTAGAISPRPGRISSPIERPLSSTAKSGQADLTKWAI